MKTLLSPQWRVFYLTLVVGLITGTLTACLVAIAMGSLSMLADPTFWAMVAVGSVLFVGFPHYVLFKVAIRRQLGQFLKLFYSAVDRPAPKLTHWSKSRELDDLGILFDDLLRELRNYIDRSVARGIEVERLQRYFSPAVVEHLLEADGGASSLQVGSRMHVTVLFCDIRGFTPWSARLSPTEVVELLNEYFSVMIETVQQERGTVLKLIGDSVMAVFGAPTSAADDTQRALRVGCAMQAAYVDLESRWKRENRAVPLGMGVGINGGEVVVGNIGSPQHLDYTVIGDTVNVASRLCGIARAGQVLVSAETLSGDQAPDGVELCAHHPVAVKGKDEEIPVYEARLVAA
jgi:class 3 adenylate cyclase